MMSEFVCIKDSVDINELYLYLQASARHANEACPSEHDLGYITYTRIHTCRFIKFSSLFLTTYS